MAATPDIESTQSDAPGEVFDITHESHGIIRVTIHSAFLADRETPQVAKRVQDALDAFEGDGPVLVFDLAAVEFLNSMGLGMLINMRNRLCDRRGRTVILKPSIHLQSLLDLVRANRLFHIFDAEESLQNFVRSEEE